MAELGYKAFDADNHYYEAEDAFTRHMDPKLRKRGIQWAEINGRKRLLVGEKVNRFIPNPTFDPVSKPGALEEYFRSKDTSVVDLHKAFGELDPIPAAYRDRDVRIKVMEEQNLEGAFFFPTLGVGMEVALKDDVEAQCASFRAFNRWLNEDWGFAYKNTIFGAPYMTLADPDWVVEELEWALEQDVRMVVMRTGPVLGKDGNYRSPGDPIFDPYWARISEAGIAVTYHGGDSGYGRYAADWGESPGAEAFNHTALKLMLSPDPTHDTMAALLTHGVFARHKNVRIAAIENGSGWVTSLVSKLKKVWAQKRNEFTEDPFETFQRHVWVSPFFEDDLAYLKQYVPPERMMMGSDFPHAEGLPVPTDWVHDLGDDFNEDEKRLIMRETPLSLSQRRPI